MIQIATDQEFTFETDELTKHAIVLGMTGSGKTGLSVRILEEVVNHGVGVLVLDLKGDISRIAVSAEKLSQELHTNIKVYTPGSTNGNPVNLLGSFKPPHDTGEDTQEASILTVSSLFALLGESPDPLSSNEHILLTKILDLEWSQNRSPSLIDLVERVAEPPFIQVGVMPLDRFITPKQRDRLVAKLNGLIASPTLHVWSQGEELDFDKILSRKEGTPLRIFYLAHLDSNQRQFFVSQFMSRLLQWSRTLSGSQSLRTLCFLDEVAGYLPPYPLNPASKRPIVTLFKQARAVGLGMILATQNPVDLDYSVISNAGTWFVGRLQTKQDREKVVAGMEANQEMGSLIASLVPRQFIIQQSSSNLVSTFYSMNTRTKLGGPLTKPEIIKVIGTVKGIRYRHSILSLESEPEETLEHFRERVAELAKKKIAEKHRLINEEATKLINPIIEEIGELEGKISAAQTDSTYRKIGEVVGGVESVLAMLAGKNRSMLSVVNRRNQSSKSANKVVDLKKKHEALLLESDRIYQQAEKDKNAATLQYTSLIEQIREV